ncbi:MAG: transcription antitermination factor NusB [Bacteroidota bacterium]
MLSRRHLRIRVMQALYAWHQTEDRSLKTSVDNLFKGTSRSYDLYLYLLQLLIEVADEEERYMADLPPRMTAAEYEHLSYLKDNIFIDFLKKDSFQKLISSRKIPATKDTDLIRKVYHQLRQKEEYRSYVAKGSHTEREDIEFCTYIFKDVISSSEPMTNSMEEQNLWWAEALELVNSMVLKTIKVAHPDKKGAYELMAEFRDEEEDREFMEKLFTETVHHDNEYEKLVSERTKNWEVERIALIDVILLKMALCEILKFPNIPVKVTINEYIDISKDYSTPKSKAFINGVLDKLVIDLRETGAVKKSGRGLIE